MQAAALLRDYAIAIASQPNHLFTVGIVPLLEGCTPRQAEEVAQFLMRFNCDNPQTTENWYVLGFYQWIANQSKEAEISLSRALHLAPHDTLSVLLRGLIRKDLGIPGWENDLVRICNSDPEFVERVVLLCSRGIIVYSALEAVRSRGLTFATLLRERCNKPSIFECELLKARARLRFNREAWGLTEQDLQAAHRLEPDDIDTIYELWLLARLQEKTTAEEVLRKELLNKVQQQEEKSAQIDWLSYISVFGDDKQLARRILDQDELKEFVDAENEALLEFRLEQTAATNEYFNHFELAGDSFRIGEESISQEKYTPWFICLLAVAANNSGDIERAHKLTQIAEKMSGTQREYRLADSIQYILLRKELATIMCDEPQICYSSTSGQVSLKHKFPNGRKSTSETTLKTSQILKLGDDELISGSEQTSTVIATNGHRAADGTLVVKYKMAAFKSTVRLPGDMKLDFDSENPDAPAPGTRFDVLLDVFKATAKSKWKCVVSQDNRVVAVKGLDKAYADLPQALRDATQAQMDTKYLKTAANDELDMLPSNPVSPGDSWERTITIRLDSGKRMKFTNKYTYEGSIQQDGRILDKIIIKATNVDYFIDGESNIKIIDSDLQIASSTGLLLFDSYYGQIVSLISKAQIKGALKLEFMGVEYPAQFDLTMETSSKMKEIP
ncbi:DUF6263 family protein [uncultured Rubinisphaera sp.]|uniref:DUF6263 family protein n=1 Tax=uncultured Rubinisphaera sp. TaxID=1678686 RepID=UPI0030D88D8D